MKKHISYYLASLALFSLCLFLCNVINAQDQKRAPKEIKIGATSNLKVSTAGKLFMVIAYLESKPVYNESQTKDDFLNAMFKDFKKESSSAIRKYFGFVYEYHKQNNHPDDVYVKENGQSFVVCYNELIKLYKPGMSKEEFSKMIGAGYGGTDPGKPWWLNWVRKIIDFIDDHWK